MHSKAYHLRHRCSWTQMPVPTASLICFVEHSRTSLFFCCLIGNKGAIMTSTAGVSAGQISTPLLPSRFQSREMRPGARQVEIKTPCWRLTKPDRGCGRGANARAVTGTVTNHRQQRIHARPGRADGRGGAAPALSLLRKSGGWGPVTSLPPALGTQGPCSSWVSSCSSQCWGQSGKPLPP